MPLYRKCAGIMLFNKEGKIFVGKRIDNHGDAWQMPQGGIDYGEDEKIAALRELHEETSVQNVKIIAESKEWLKYNLPDSLRNKLWGGKYKGQMQKWYLMEFLGYDDEINIKVKNAEFKEWKWVDIDLLPDLIVEFKRDIYAKLVSEFKPILEKLEFSK